MDGRLVWLTDEDVSLEAWDRRRILEAFNSSPPDPVRAFIEATRDRLGDPEWATETIALGLRALGRPYPLADQRETLL